MFVPALPLSLALRRAAASLGLLSAALAASAQPAQPSAWDEPLPGTVAAPASAPVGAVVEVPAAAPAPAVKQFVPPPAVGEITRGLLALQAQGSVASPHSYAMPGAVAQVVYQRYLKSFEHPIPEKSGSTLDTKK